MAVLILLGIVNLSFAYVEGESLLMAMKDIALSSGRCVARASTRSLYPLVCLCVQCLYLCLTGAFLRVACHWC